MRFTSEELGGESRAEKQEGGPGTRATSHKLNVFHMRKETSPPAPAALPESLKERLPLGNSHEVGESPHFSARDLILTAFPFLTRSSRVPVC